jgi:putative FmdB family regulatory protein
MPIYEYRCASCGHELEALQKLSDAPLTDCPACRETALKKKLSAAGFHLKGSGWYVTDFRSSGSKPAAKDAGGKDGAKDGAKPNGGDAKPEVKSGGGHVPLCGPRHGRLDADAFFRRRERSQTRDDSVQ